MSASLESFHYHVADDPQVGPDARARPAHSFAARAAAEADGEPQTPPFTSNEAAARYFLDELLQRDDRPAMRAVVEAERPERVPSLVVEHERDLHALRTHQVGFAQTHRSIPVFGARAVVELTPERELVSIAAHLAEVSGVDAVESISRSEALERVALSTGTAVPADAGVAGHLTFYRDDADIWHLAWFFPELPAVPRSSGGTAVERDAPDPFDGHGFGPRPVPASYNFLVDAHDGAILFAYSALPTVQPVQPTVLPTRCTGIDEDAHQQTFFGRLVEDAGTAVLLDDPVRSVRTYDLDFANLDDDPSMPAEPVRAATSDFATTNRAAVSAHLNAGRVQDFYRTVLQRDGIDDLGMVLVSLVNTTAAAMQPPPALRNAFWWRRRMWYGQVERGDRLVSLARYLDVVGHELTHGVVESTSGLIYATQSGALNESFADIAGVIIHNWYTAPDRADVSTWAWEIGAGLRSDGRPLRDLADPARLGHPAHMKDFRRLAPGERPGPDNDQGWVHFNSNIHNKAAHNMLTATANGTRVFTVEDVTILMYFGMARLAPMATFDDALRAVEGVARTYFGGDADRAAKVAAIREAYRLVGIG